MDRRKKGWLTLTALTLLLIWGNSLLSGTVSGSISEWVKNLLNIPLTDVTGSGMADDAVLRKVAHATEFALLGAELTVVLRVLWNKAGSLLLLCGMSATLLDETIQLFSAGRAGMVKDIWIDLGGFCLGVGLIWLLRRKKRKQIQPEEKSRDVSG